MDGSQIFILICCFLAALITIIIVVNKYRDLFKDYQINKRKIKALTLNTLVTLSILCLIFVVCSTIVFQEKEAMYGANTKCILINSDNENYHAADCTKLSNNIYREPLWLAIAFGYEECPNCTKNSKYHKTCYFTDTGDCFHYLGCHYLKESSNPTTVFEALGGGFEPCSYCVKDIDDDKEYVIETQGVYFHTNWCSRSSEPETTITTITSNVYQATKKNYTACSICDVGQLDVTYQRTPIDYNVLFSIACSIAIYLFAFPFFRLIYIGINSRIISFQK